MSWTLVTETGFYLISQRYWCHVHAKPRVNPSVKEELSRWWQCVTYRSIEVSCKSLCDVHVAFAFLQDIFDSLNCPFNSTIALMVIRTRCHVTNVELFARVNWKEMNNYSCKQFIWILDMRFSCCLDRQITYFYVLCTTPTYCIQPVES